MEKKTISVHAFTVHLYTVAVVVLGVALLALGLKYLHLKLAVKYYTQGALYQQMNQAPIGSISDYGTIVAVTVAQYPQDKPLYTQPLVLESYVQNISKSVHRDVVVMDANQKVLADSVTANMGSKYSQDTGEIGLTLKDGVSRTFTETSKDYPQGLSEQVVAMRNNKNEIIGVILISNTVVSK